MCNDAAEIRGRYRKDEARPPRPAADWQGRNYEWRDKNEGCILLQYRY